nr:proteasome subunit beta type-4 [Tanacetum cinerariifolium]
MILLPQLTEPITFFFSSETSFTKNRLTEWLSLSCRLSCKKRQEGTRFEKLDQEMDNLLSSEGDSQRTQYPYVTGTSVVGIKYKDGILMAADMGGSYGSTIRYKSIERLKQVGKHTLLGASGEISDYQEILKYLDELILHDNMWDDGNSLGPKEVHNYLTRVMYNRRNKFDPLWNSLILGGVKNGQKYLGSVSMIGVHFEDDHVATGFGNHLARPILREEWREDLTFEEGVKLLEKCMRNLLYRDRSAVNKVQIAKITEEGMTISQPYSLKTYWDFAAFKNPTRGSHLPWKLDVHPLQSYGLYILSVVLQVQGLGLLPLLGLQMLRYHSGCIFIFRVRPEWIGIYLEVTLDTRLNIELSPWVDAGWTASQRRILEMVVNWWKLRSTFLRWWELEDIVLDSYEDWLVWFNNVRLSKKLKELFEGVNYVMWCWYQEPKFLFKMPLRRSEGEELEYPFFEGNDSSSHEWGDYGVAGDDYEGAPVFDDDYEEASVLMMRRIDAGL